MTIGNWNISETKIEWKGGDANIFEIERSQLLEPIKIDDESDEDLYKWIVIATTEDWLTVDDLYDLNFAFVYAAGASGSSDFSYERFDKTVEYQYNMIDEEEETEYQFKIRAMKNNSGKSGNDGNATNNKGESTQSKQKGASGVSKKGAGKHTKDESSGAKKNTTKKQNNSI